MCPRASFKGNLNELKSKVDCDSEVLISTTFGIDHNSVMLHYHPYIEICYVKNGTGEYLIDGKKYEFQTGDVFVINANQIHLAYNDKDVIIQVVLFKPEYLLTSINNEFYLSYVKPYWEFGSEFDNKLDQGNEVYPDIIVTLDEIQKEKSSGHKTSDYMIKALILKLSTLLMRYTDLRRLDDAYSDYKGFYKFDVLSDYIRENLNKKIMLKDMARLMNMSISSFSQLFKKTYGTSPMDFIIRIRVVKATEYLVRTDMRVIDVAPSCGFSSMSHFNSCFKKYTGLSPREFKKNIKK